MTEPLRLLQVGAGSMGRAWLRTIAASPDAVLVGLADLDTGLARAAADELGHSGVPVTTSADLLAEEVGAEAVIDVTVPAAHPSVTMAALGLGLPVLCEKPLAESVRQGLAMAAAAEAAGRLLMVSQSRRYFRTGLAFGRQIAELGPVASLTCQFFKAPRFGGFRERMAEPLLVDMAIHQFDLARKLIGAEPLSVYCESYNPPWSWYAGQAAADAVFTFEGGARFAFTGSWCAPGLETSWNGNWRASAATGSAVWNGDGPPVAQLASGEQVPAVIGAEAEEIAGSLAEFVSAVRTSAVPQSAARSNVISVAMVEAAVRSASTGERVAIADVLAEGLAEALAAEQDSAAHAVLKSWQ